MGREEGGGVGRSSMYEVGTRPVLWESRRTEVQPPSVILLVALSHVLGKAMLTVWFDYDDFFAFVH